MSFKKNDKRYDFEVCCPYNKKHQMPFSKLWFHISKGCKDKREKGHRYEVCPFNCLHIIAKAKFEDHKMKCRYKSDAQNAQEDDLFKEMQLIAGQQFGGGSNNQQSLCQSNISSIPQNKSLPNWRDIWETQSEADDVEELNSISSLNEKYFEEEEYQHKQQLSSGISKSFQSSGIREQDQGGDDDYYY